MGAGESVRWERVDIDSIDSGEFELRTGDLVLFSGTSMFSRAVRLITHSDMSHVAMVVRHKNHPQYAFLVESVVTRDSYVDFKTQQLKAGVRVVDAPLRIREYHGSVFVRRLNVRVQTRKYLEKQAWEVIDEKISCGYDHRLDTVLVALAPTCSACSPIGTPKRFHCASLVAYIYERANLLIRQEELAEFTPEVFTPERDEWLRFKDGIDELALADPVRIVRPAGSQRAELMQRAMQ